MILTEDRSYVISLDMKESDDGSGLGNKQVELEFTNRELLHAIITCGMPMQRLTPVYMGKRKAEILYKIFLVEAALEAEGDRLKKSGRTMYLDSSEKSVISYYLGMFFTKLISRRLFDVDYLVHLNMVENMQGDDFIDYFCSDWRQDMIGFKIEDNSWSVWEAKGGSNHRGPALKKGCEQADNIAVINGIKPNPAAVCMTYYDHGYLQAVVKKTEGKDGVPVTFRENQFFETYYKPLRELFLEHRLNINRELQEVEIEIPVPYFGMEGSGKGERKLRIGMPGMTFRTVVAQQYEDVARWDREKWIRREGCFCGEDLVYIK